MADEKKKTFEEERVDDFFEHVHSKTETAMKAAFKRADNPNTEYQCWEYLPKCTNYKVNFKYPKRKLPFITVFSSIAHSDRCTDGTLKFGEALLAAYDYDRDSEPARARLRRVLACDSVEEVCAVLRSVLRFITSKDIGISYASLLRDLRYFDNAPKKVKARWAQQFYGNIPEGDKESNK